MFDVIIIGGGPGGYVAAIRASQLGLKVGLVEKDNLGGICLNWGCIPTKALLKSAEVYRKSKNSSNFGINSEKVTIDFSKVIANSRDTANKLSAGISMLMKKNKIEVFKGFASFVDKNTILVKFENQKEEKIKSKYIVVSTGARARILNGFDPKENINIWSYREAMVAKEQPKELIVIGSGAIGLEFASFYATLGTKVTVLDAAKNIMINEDSDIRDFAKKVFQKDKIDFLDNVKVVECKNIDKDRVELKFFDKNQKEQTLISDKILVAAGVVPNVENMKLCDISVNFEKNHQISVDEYMRTSVENIFAIGDVCSKGQSLAHVASHQGVLAIESIAKELNKYNKSIHPINYSNVPACTYSYPQIASVGLTEGRAKELGYDFKVGKFSFAGNGKAVASKEDGLVKIIFCKKTGELIGAHMVGYEVTEMIQGFVIGKQAELIDEDYIHTVFAHPTISESMHEAVLDANGMMIHM